MKTPRLSFYPYKSHAPYITARPEVNCRLISKGSDRVLILASDGVWERASGDDVLRWVRNYYNDRIAGVYRGKYLSRKRRQHRETKTNQQFKNQDNNVKGEDATVSNVKSSQPQITKENKEKHLDALDQSQLTATKRKIRGNSVIINNQRRITRRKNKRHSSHEGSILAGNSVSDLIVHKVLNKVRRARNIDSLRTLMNLPKGRARRSKHDDITASVIDVSGFIS